MLLTGVTLGVLYNPWTGPATREWIMDQVSGGNGDGFKEFTDAVEADATAMGDAASDAAAKAKDAAKN
jgi:hypothetical protein